MYIYNTVAYGATSKLLAFEMYFFRNLSRHSKLEGKKIERYLRNYEQERSNFELDAVQLLGYEYVQQMEVHIQPHRYAIHQDKDHQVDPGIIG